MPAMPVGRGAGSSPEVFQRSCEGWPGVALTGRDTGATSSEFGQYLMNTVEDSRVEARWEEYVQAG